MENQDHRATVPSGVHLCHKCGWPFPNPHPSAKHRRAHKKVCGTIEGYLIAESEDTHLGVSDDEDEDKPTPSPKVNDKSLKEPIASFKSTRSEDELFSDAMTEFSDSTLNQGMDQGLETVRKLDSSEALGDPSQTRQLGDPQLLDCEMKSLDVMTVGSTSKENSVGVNEPSSDPIKSEALVAPIVENVKVTGEKEMSSDRQEIYVKESEHGNVSEILTDAVEPDSVKSTAEEEEEKIARLSQEVEVDSVEAANKISNGADVKILNPHDLKSDQCQTDGQASEVASLDRKIELNDEMETEIQTGDKTEVFLQVPSLQKTDTTDTDSSCQNEEDVHLLSTEKDIPFLRNAELVIQDYKDHKSLKSTFALDLGDGVELSGSAQDDVKSTLEEDQSKTNACSPDRSLLVPPSILDVSGDDIRKDDDKAPKDGSEVMSDELSASTTLEAPVLTVEPTNSHSMLEKSSQDSSQQVEPLTNSDDSSVTPCMGDEVRQTIPTVSDATGDEIRKDDGEVPIVEKVDPDRPELITDEKLGSFGSLSSPATVEDESSQSSSQPFKPLGDSDSNSNAHCMGEEVMSGESSNFQDCVVDKTEASFSDENESRKGNLHGEYSADTKIGESRDADDSFISEETQTPVFHGGDGHSDFENFGTKCSDVAMYSSTVETDEKSVKLTGGGAEDDQTGVDDDSLHDKAGTEVPNIVGSEHTEEDAKDKMVNTEPIHASSVEILESTNVTGADEQNSGNVEQVSLLSEKHVDEVSQDKHYEDPGLNSVNSAQDKIVNMEPIHDSSMEVLESTNAAVVDERSCGNVEQVSFISGKHVDEGLQEKHFEFPLSSESSSLPIELNSEKFATAENNDAVNATTSTSGVDSLALKDEGDNKIAKQHEGVTPVDTSLASSSRTDSLEANWGSVSVLSLQSESTAAVDGEAPEKSSSQNTKTERNHGKTDSFEPPSFMTLVESGSGHAKSAPEIENAQSSQHPNSEALKAGWFPSLNKVVNESQGRKKNEEIIAKVTNWSTGKQHTPLKNLLGEAKSPNTKQVRHETPNDETATQNSAAKVTTVNSILSFDAPGDQAVNRDVEKEWNSPARYPVDIKKEKKKGRAYWVPFVCCSSVH